MGRARVRIAAAIIALALAGAEGLAQDSTRVLRVAAVSGEGIDAGEASALQSLVTSYVVELKMFRVIDDSGQELALKEAETAVELGQIKDLAPLVADYVLSAKVDKAGTFLVFTMAVTKVSSGEGKSVADTFVSVNDLILGIRRLTRNLFEGPQDLEVPSVAAPGTTVRGVSGAAAQNSAAAAPAPTLPLVAGTWQGDKNVDRVTIMPDGRGFAVLASGVRMAVKVSVEGTAVIVVQDQPNSPDFYRPALDLKSARVVAAAARPWRWVFSLSADANSLSGVKESVFVQIDTKGEVSVDNNYVRDSAWTRLYR